MAHDFLSTFRTYLSKLTDGDKGAGEVATAVNQWIREGGEALKVKIEDEVERSVSKMGFVKRGEFEALKEEVARLSILLNSSSSVKNPSVKRPPAKAAVKKPAVKKSATNISSKNR